MEHLTWKNAVHGSPGEIAAVGLHLRIHGHEIREGDVVFAQNALARRPVACLNLNVAERVIAV